MFSPLRTALASGALTAVLAACSGGGAAASATPPAEADVTIDAESNAFSADTITLTAGEPMQLFFRNLDGSEHNVAIYTDDSAAQALFVGENVSDGAVLYELPPLEPGEYFFRCDVHPSMTGTVVVEGGS
jgi:plastocyanin